MMSTQEHSLQEKQSIKVEAVYLLIMNHCREAKKEGGYILYDVVIQSSTRMSVAVPHPLIPLVIGSLTMVLVVPF